jgi:mannose-1-phosphate guanylyltransferase
LGTRLRPLTDSTPKCLVRIDGRALLDYWIELLCSAGGDALLVNLHYLPDTVRAHIAASRYAARIRTVHEERLLGTAGTLLRNRAFFQGGSAMLVHADNLSLFDVAAFQRRFDGRPEGVDITMMTFSTDRPESCGIVELDDRGVVTRFHEKVARPPGNLANGAVYLLAPSVFDFLAALGKDVIDFSTEVLPHYMGRINTFHNDVYHRDIGTLESLAAAQVEYPAAAARYARVARKA